MTNRHATLELIYFLGMQLINIIEGNLNFCTKLVDFCSVVLWGLLITIEPGSDSIIKVKAKLILNKRNGLLPVGCELSLAFIIHCWSLALREGSKNKIKVNGIFH